MHEPARSTSDSARPIGRRVRLRASAWVTRSAGALTILAITLATTSVRPRAQAGVVTTEWVSTLREFAESDQAEVRGEAALALAKLGDPADLPRVLATAEDRDPAAHIPATIGLGYLATPGVEITLGQLFDSKEARLEGQRLAAAIALGLLPHGHPAPRRAEFLSAIPGSSYARNEEKLAAWLIGVILSSEPADKTMVRFLVEEVSNKRERLHLLAMHALERFHESVDPERLAEMRRDADSRIRVAAMQLTPPGALRDAKTQREVIRATESDHSVEVRVAALELLTRERSFAALERAGDAVESDDALEAAASVRTILTFGGHVLRRALERRVLENDIRFEHRTAMLRAWSGRPSPQFTEDLLRIASDHRSPVDLACAAAAAAAASKDPRAAPILRRLLRREGVDLDTVVSGLHQLDATDAMFSVKAEVSATLSDRLVAVLALDARAGLIHLQSALERRILDPEQQARCLRVWHGSLQRRLPDALGNAAPQKLHRVFSR